MPVTVSPWDFAAERAVSSSTRSASAWISIARAMASRSRAWSLRGQEKRSFGILAGCRTSTHPGQTAPAKARLTRGESQELLPHGLWSDDPLEDAGKKVRFPDDREIQEDGGIRNNEFGSVGREREWALRKQAVEGLDILPQHLGGEIGDPALMKRIQKGAVADPGDVCGDARRCLAARKQRTGEFRADIRLGHLHRRRCVRQCNSHGGNDSRALS